MRHDRGELRADLKAARESIAELANAMPVSIMQDISDLPPADPSLPTTLSINEFDLEVILERYALKAIESLRQLSLNPMNDEKTNPLVSCGNCGKDEQEYCYGDFGSNVDGVAIVCGSCGCQTPARVTKEEAAQSWNEFWTEIESLRQQVETHNTQTLKYQRVMDYCNEVRDSGFTSSDPEKQLKRLATEMIEITLVVDKVKSLREETGDLIGLALDILSVAEGQVPDVGTIIDQWCDKMIERHSIEPYSTFQPNLPAK